MSFWIIGREREAFCTLKLLPQSLKDNLEATKLGHVVGPWSHFSVQLVWSYSCHIRLKIILDFFVCLFWLVRFAIPIDQNNQSNTMHAPNHDCITDGLLNSSSVFHHGTSNWMCLSRLDWSKKEYLRFHISLQSALASLHRKHLSHWQEWKLPCPVGGSSSAAEHLWSRTLIRCEPPM